MCVQVCINLWIENCWKNTEHHQTSFFHVSFACFMVSKFSFRRLFSLFFSFRACSRYAIWLRYFWNTEIIIYNALRKKCATVTEKKKHTHTKKKHSTKTEVHRWLEIFKWKENTYTHMWILYTSTLTHDANTQTDIHTHKKHTHTNTHPYIHTPTHMHTYTHTHTPTHTHTHRLNYVGAKEKICCAKSPMSGLLSAMVTWTYKN